MYVPTNIAAPTATYAPVVATPNTAALAQTQAASSVRQTELALTGLGPSLFANSTTARQTLVPAASRNVASSPLSQSAALVDDGGADTSPLATSTPRAAQPMALLMPRPAYIAAHFLAQDLSPQEVAGFFISDAPPVQRDNAVRQQNQLRDMRMALGMENNATQAIAIRQPAPRADAAAPSTPATQQAATGSALPATQQQVRRSSVAQAYDAANLRNALLASAPEVDTRS